MTINESNRRQFLTTAGAGALAAVLLPACATAKSDSTSAPWPRRFFNLFTNAAGVSEMREVAIKDAGKRVTKYLLRHEAARVTVGSMEPNMLMDWHVANQPNIIIPMFGTLVVILKDGSRYELVHGDILYAEDCTGEGHKSGAGPEGEFGISVQLDQSYCPAVGGSYLNTLLGL